ncbi:uncharacterized protein FIESC28_07277 [Fusarium coffeatum]|uniref:Uncharacterized protein n=1 Tax=Fusarium coffeatum TaxID=231269 RepID=A0A366RGV3_9HYPO|nr:uncharacterized protein FIESC28_07277 [Fusarium coffeatum]RBR15636.1 hypothetical protein FIESC28_07277 [Fusarium coffeatum]
MDSPLNSAKRLVAKVFAKKSPQKVAKDQEWKAYKAKRRESERALKRHRRNARMDGYKNH